MGMQGKACKTILSAPVAIIPLLDFLDFTWAVSSVSFISILASAIVRSYDIRTCGIHVTLAFRWTLVNILNQMNTTKQTRWLHFQTLILILTTLGADHEVDVCQYITWLMGMQGKACKTILSASVAIIPLLDFLDFTWAVSSVSFISILATAIVRSYGIRTYGIIVTLVLRRTLVNVWNKLNIGKINSWFTVIRTLYAVRIFMVHISILQQNLSISDLVSLT